MITARHAELTQLATILNSSKAELIAIYGRRRVGKTYLIREFFKDRVDLYFSVTGQSKGSNAFQRELFKTALEKTFFADAKIPKLKNWQDAFNCLFDNVQSLLQKKELKKVVIFIDELPWLAGKNSDLLASLEHAWNTKFQYLSQVKFIICGSAASWIIKKIINAKGGLHNRLTGSLHLKPFSLAESAQYLKSLGFDNWSKANIMEIYMIFGGIPHYLRLLDANLSLSQNIAKLFFNQGLLHNELDNLYEALFEKGQEYSKIVEVLASKKSGLTRRELVSEIKNVATSELYVRLKELELSGFIASEQQFDSPKKNMLLRVIDEFSLFALTWLKNKDSILNNTDNFWIQESSTQKYKIWCGYAFENLCYKNSEKIKELLGFKAVRTKITPYRKITDNNQGVQIDLVFDRDDKVIVLLEIKYRAEGLVLTQKLFEELSNKAARFIEQTGTRKNIVKAILTNAPVQEQDKFLQRNISVIDAEEFLGK